MISGCCDRCRRELQLQKEYALLEASLPQYRVKSGFAWWPRRDDYGNWHWLHRIHLHQEAYVRYHSDPEGTVSWFALAWKTYGISGYAKKRFD